MTEHNKPRRCMRFGCPLLSGRMKMLFLACLLLLIGLSFTTRGCSDDRNLSGAPKFVANQTHSSEPKASGKKPPAATAKTEAAEEAPYGLPLNIVFEDVPATPEKLAEPTPLSALENE